MINKLMLEEKIVFFNTEEFFTYASGIKSPIYCDCRLSLSNSELRGVIKENLALLVEDCDILIGTATAGIPHAAILADSLNLPMGYVRSSAKKHGRCNMIEGINDIKGKNVIIVEDLITTGKSVLEVVDILEEAGANIIKVIAIFSYNFEQAKQNFKARNINYATITNINNILDYAHKTKYLKEEQISVVNDFLSGK